MADQETTIRIEIPSVIQQQEIWDTEERLRQVEGIETDLQEPRNVLDNVILVLHIAASVMTSIAAVGGGVKAIHEVAKIVHDFLHKESKENSHNQAKKKIVIVKKGKRVEVYDLSVEEIEKFLKE